MSVVLLLGEWQKYEDIDFDQSLLTRAYQAATKEVKAQISEKSRTAGRVELIKIITSTKSGFDVEKMTEKDWATFVDILEVQPDRKEIWRFLYNAPPIWSKKLLDKLVKASYNWFMQDEEITIKALFTLSGKSKEENFAFIPYLLMQESPHKTLDGNITKKLDSLYGWKLYFSPDSRILFGLHDVNPKRIWLWSLPDGNLLKTIENTSQSSFPSDIGILAVSPDSRILVSSGGEKRSNEINLWSLPSGNHIKTLKVKIPPSARPDSQGFMSLAISPDGRILASRCCIDSSVCQFSDNVQQMELKKRIPQENTIDIWSLPSGHYLRSIRSPFDSQMAFFNARDFFPQYHMVISPDSLLLASGTKNGNIGIWNLSNGNHTIFKQSQPVYSNSGSTYGFCSIKPISSNGRILAANYRTQTREQTFYLWSFPDGNHFKTLLNCTDIAMSHDNRFLVSAHDDKLMGKSQKRKEMTELSDYPIHLWSLTNGSLLRTLTASNGHVSWLQISPDNRVLLSLSKSLQETCLQLWNLPDGNLLKTLSNFNLRSAQISPDGNILVGTTKEDGIKLWNLPHSNSNIPISKFTNQDIAEISSKISSSEIETSFGNTLKFILALTNLRQQFDIDIEDSSNDIPSSEFDIEIEG